jgi:hypothetical protein
LANEPTKRATANGKSYNSNNSSDRDADYGYQIHLPTSATSAREQTITSKCHQSHTSKVRSWGPCKHPVLSSLMK